MVIWCRNPLGEVCSVSRMESKFFFSSACSSGLIGALLSGVSQSATF